MHEGNYDERLAKEVLENWSTIRLGAFNAVSKAVSSTWAAIEGRIGSYSESKGAPDRYRDLLKGLSVVESGKIVKSPFRPPSAEASFRCIQRLHLEAKAEREVAELEFALALFERFCQCPRLTLSALVNEVERELHESNLFLQNTAKVMQNVYNTTKIDVSRAPSFNRAQILYRHMYGLPTDLSVCERLPDDHLTERFNSAVGMAIDQPLVRNRWKRRKRKGAHHERLSRKNGALIKIKQPRIRTERPTATSNDSDVEKKMLEDDYDERLAKEVLDNWPAIRLSAYNQKISKEASSAWAAIEERIGAFSESTGAHDRYRDLLWRLNAMDTGKCRGAFSFRPPSAEESFRNIQRLYLEARTEREVSELEFALALFESFRQKPRLSLSAHVAATVKEFRACNSFVRYFENVLQAVKRASTIPASKARTLSRAQILYRQINGVSTDFSQCKAFPVDQMTERFNSAVQTVLAQPLLHKDGRRRPRTFVRLERIIRKSGTTTNFKKSPLTRAQRQAAVDNDGDVEKKMLEDDYDERLAKEALDNWSTIRLAAFNPISKAASSTWAAIEQRIGAFSESTGAHDRYRALLFRLNAMDTGTCRGAFSFRPPSAEEKLRNIQRLSHEAKAEREVAEVEFALALFERVHQTPRLSLAAHVEATVKEFRHSNSFVRHFDNVLTTVYRASMIDASKARSISRAQILYRQINGVPTDLSQGKTLFPNDHLTERFNSAVQTVLVLPPLRKDGRRLRTFVRLERIIRKSGAITKFKKSPFTRAQRQAAVDNDSDVEITYVKPAPITPLVAREKRDASNHDKVKSSPHTRTPLKVKIEKCETPTEFSTQSHSLSNTLTDQMNEGDDDDPFEQTLLLLDEADLLGTSYPMVQEARRLLDGNPFDLESKKVTLQKFSAAFKALKSEIKNTQNEEIAYKRRRGLEVLRSLHAHYFAQAMPSVA